MDSKQQDAIRKTQEARRKKRNREKLRNQFIAAALTGLLAGNKRPDVSTTPSDMSMGVWLATQAIATADYVIDEIERGTTIQRARGGV